MSNLGTSIKRDELLKIVIEDNNLSTLQKIFLISKITMNPISILKSDFYKEVVDSYDDNNFTITVNCYSCKNKKTFTTNNELVLQDALQSFQPVCSECSLTGYGPQFSRMKYKN